MATSYTSREDVPEQEKWDLTDLYENEEAWQKDVDTCKQLADELAQFEDNITDASSLLAYLKKQEHLSLIARKVFAYSMFLSDIDTRDTNAQRLSAKQHSSA